jgi:hypothetical protein
VRVSPERDWAEAAHPTEKTRKTTSTNETLQDVELRASQSARNSSAHVAEISSGRHKAVAAVFPSRCRTANYRGLAVVRGVGVTLKTKMTKM